ncbi:MAG: 2,3,4,5-tetrahydropyridine-2,6-dicarboxylate N-succinyltransferase, partial [Actinomycetota bacterium]
MSIAYGHGLVSKSKSGAILDAHFKVLGLGKLSSSSAPDLANLGSVDEIRGVRREPISIEIDLGAAPKDVPDAYLRLHLLSHRTIKPHGAVLDGIFGILNNVV